MAKPVKSITIVGGGASGWLTAAYLAGLYRRRVQSGDLALTVIESPDVGIIGVGESTARPMADMLRILQIRESDFIRRCNATFKLSGWFADWDVDEAGKPVSWVNPFFSQSDLHGVNPAYLFASYGMHPGGGPTEEGYTEAISVCPSIIRAHKGPRRIGAGDYKADIPYSYHMDAVKLAEILQERGKELGVRQILDHVEEVKLDDKGFVSELQLRENGAFPIEFIIDATGFASIILNKALGEPFDPYDKYLLNDRAAVMQLPHEDPKKIEPTSRATALGAGWSFRVPLYNRVGSGYIFSSKFISDDEAIAEFKRHAGPAAADGEPRIIRMRIGKARRSWVKNCLALGLSSGFVEPLEATAIYSVQVALQWLHNYFPHDDFDPAVSARYNKLIDGFYDEIIDFICLLFCISNRDDTPYWKAVRHEMEIPPRLKENLELWKHTMPDALDLGAYTFFSPTSYRAALFGKQYYKGRDYAQVSPLSEQEWKQYLQMRRDRTNQFLNVLPDHYELLTSIRNENRNVSFSMSSSVLTGGGI